MVRRGGGFTQLVNLVPAILAQAPETQFLLLARGESVASALPNAPNLELAVLPEARPLQRILFSVGQASSFARRFEADLYYSVSETAGMGLPCPVVVSFRNPNVFTSLDQRWGPYQASRLMTLRRSAIHSARRASRVIFVSHDSAKWIGDSVDLDESKRVVIRHGVDPSRWQPPSGKPSSGAGILFVSSVYRYKNFVRLIEAWRRVAAKRPDPPELTLLGDVVDRRHARDIDRARAKCGRLASKIHITGAVNYEKTADYYHKASLFVFPSYLETFGHPLLEAMASGVPVAASETAVSREVAGDAAIYFDPFDVDSASLAIERALDDPALRDSLIAAGHRRVKEFTWEDTARQTLRLFAEILGVPEDATVLMNAPGAH